MLLDLIAQYYKYLWFILGAIAFIKIIVSTIFHGGLEGINGVIFALFNWYSDDEQEMEDLGRRRTTMRIQNFITLLLYIVISVIVIATVIPFVLG